MVLVDKNEEDRWVPTQTPVGEEPGRSRPDAFRLLLADWERQSTTRRYSTRLRQWAQAEPALDVARGEDLVEACCYYTTSEDQDRACRVLEALARLSQAGDDLAMLTILRGLMSRLTYMVDRAGRFLRPG